MSKRVLGRSFRKKKILRSVPRRVESSKNFKNPKRPKIIRKSVQTCFEHVLGWFFWKSFFAQCSMEGRAFENFQKNQKNFKIQKMPLIVSKSVHTCFENALGRFIRIFFCPVFHAGLFRFSGLKNMSSVFWTQKKELSFPDLKIWVQFYDTLLKRHSFCIHATVNIRNPISDFLDLKIWAQIPQFKNKGLVFRT